MSRLETPSGSEVELRAATDDLVALVRWSYARFDQAGIGEPGIAVIDFAPDPDRCHRRAGYLGPDGNGVEIAICLTEDSMCRRIDGVVLTSPGKLCLLHEMAHAWLAQHLTTATRTAFLEHASLTTWWDAEVRWHERGVEYAAETLAWGLMDRRLRMVRIGDPTVDHLETGYRLLTGAEPIVDLLDPARAG